MLLSPRPGAPRRRDAPGWREFAACEGEDLDTFFPVGVTGPALWQIQRAKAICADCPVRQQCLDYAMGTGQDFGIWGGLTSEERRDLRREQRRAERRQDERGA